MPLTLHTIAAKPGSRTKRFRVGRGPGSGSGKTSGRGTKGQRSRSGGRKRLGLKGMKQMLLGFPKSRGFQSRFIKPEAVSLEALNQFDAGSTVDQRALKRANLISRAAVAAKIVGGGELKKALTIDGLGATATAKQAIEKAGGKFVNAVKPSKNKSRNKKPAKA